MKTANSALLAILSGPGPFYYADLWTIALRTGVTKYYTDWGTDLTVGGNTFSSSGALLTGAKYKLERGLVVDESDVTLYPAPTETVNGISFIKAVKDGLFDRATVTRQRQFMATPGDLTPNAPMIFLGEVTDSSPTRNAVILKVKSMPNLLNIYMPRRQYQPTCGWVFGDAATCTFSRSSVSSTATSGSTQTMINCSLSDAAGTYTNGTVTFTSGVNSGVKRSVKSYTPGIVTLNGPFPNTPASGDTFTISAGCSRNFAGAASPFNGSTNAGSTNTDIYCGLANSAGYFNGGTLQYTSGTNVGQIRTVSTWLPGHASLSSAMPNVPALGDEFVITSLSSNTVSTCSGYSNTAHFGGFPFIPVPETAT